MLLHPARIPNRALDVQLSLTTPKPVGDECGGAEHQAQPSSCVPKKPEKSGTDVYSALS